MKRRYQVFISSTFHDLEAARREVSSALLSANCFPAGMELFPAADEAQFEFIKRVISESDYYVLIVAGKYGSVHPATGLSFTEMEYNYAVSIGVPVIRLLHRNPFEQLQGSQIEQDRGKRLSLERFRREVAKDRLVKYWSDYSELGKHVVLGLLEAQERFPAKGWVRSNSVGGEEQLSIQEDIMSAIESLVRATTGERAAPNQIDTANKSSNFSPTDEVFEALSSLAASTATQLDDVFSAISGHCNLALLRSDEKDRNYYDLIGIDQYTNRGASLAGQLLAFSRRQRMTYEELDLVEVVDDLKHLIQRLLGPGRFLDLDLGNTGVAVISADKRQIEQVILNLVVNARDAMPNGGSVAIRAGTKFIPDDIKGQSSLSSDSYAAIEIEDQGIGIPTSLQDKVFQPFFTTKAEGTGLGLATALGVIKQSGGDIVVQSRKGLTTFTVLLPLNSNP